MEALRPADGGAPSIGFAAMQGGGWRISWLVRRGIGTAIGQGAGTCLHGVQISHKASEGTRSG